MISGVSYYVSVFGFHVFFYRTHFFSLRLILTSFNINDKNLAKASPYGKLKILYFVHQHLVFQTKSLKINYFLSLLIIIHTAFSGVPKILVVF